MSLLDVLLVAGVVLWALILVWAIAGVKRDTENIDEYLTNHGRRLQRRDGNGE